MKPVRAIAVVTKSLMRDHTANAGEKLLGNAGSIKQRPDGRVYISGQMQRHALFSAIERCNDMDDGRADTYVSNGDGVTNQLTTDLRADLGGFLHPAAGSYSGRRTSPISATPAVALQPSNRYRDLLIRLKQSPGGEEGDQKQAVATTEVSQEDEMVASFFLDLTTAGVSRRYFYGGEKKQLHLRTEVAKHVSNDERNRRARLFLESTSQIVDYANQARRATTGEPQQVVIILDTRLSRKVARFFDMSEIERTNLFAELADRDADCFMGDDTGQIPDAKPVFQAYKQALTKLRERGIVDPTSNQQNRNGREAVPFAQFHGMQESPSGDGTAGRGAEIIANEESPSDDGTPS